MKYWAISMGRIPTYIIILGLFWGGNNAAQAIDLIDWTHADGTFTDGNLNQTFEGTAGGINVDYTGTLDDPGVNMQGGAPNVWTQATTPFALNGTGAAADHYLDIWIGGAEPGEGTTHTFTFDTVVDGLDFTLWDIDASAVHDEEVVITATLRDGTLINPSSGTIANPAVVTQDSATTWSGLPPTGAGDQSTDGNLAVRFDQQYIRSISISFNNAADAPGTAGSQWFGLHNIAYDAVSVVPEPATLCLLAIGALVIGSTRKKQKENQAIPLENI